MSFVFVRDIARPLPATVTPATPARDCARLMRAHRCRQLPVVREDGRLCGLVFDLALLSLETGYDPRDQGPDPDSLSQPERPARDLMVVPELVARPDDRLVPLLWRLAESIDDAALVIDPDDRPTGLLTENAAVALAAGQLDGAPTVERFHTPRLFWVPPDAPRSAAREALVQAGVRHLLLLDHGRLTGVLSARDLSRGGWPRNLERDGAASPPVQALVGRPPITIDSTMPIRAAAQMMVDLGIGCLPIVDHGEVTGVVTRTDIIRTLAEALGAR